MRISQSVIVDSKGIEVDVDKDECWPFTIRLGKEIRLYLDEEGAKKLSDHLWACLKESELLK